jgi:hypothetical protein
MGSAAGAGLLADAGFPRPPSPTAPQRRRNRRHEAAADQTHLSNPQDFIASRQVLVRVRANEPVSFFAGGQLELPNVTWGIYSKRAHGSKGQKLALRLRIPPKARAAAAEAFAKGRKVIAKVTVSATDRAGNESGATVASIRQKR